MPLPYACANPDEIRLGALKIYNALFLWLCTVSFCTVWGAFFAFPLEFGVNCFRLYFNRIYLRIPSFQAPTHPIRRVIDGVVGDHMVVRGMDSDTIPSLYLNHTAIPSFAMACTYFRYVYKLFVPCHSVLLNLYNYFSIFTLLDPGPHSISTTWLYPLLR